MKKNSEKKNVYRDLSFNNIVAPLKTPSTVKSSKITGKGDLRGGKK